MRRKLPPLNAIKAFEAVARHEHLGRAAEELCVSHSALSQQISHLESWFGLDLFTRIAGRILLTPQGRQLLPTCTHALDHILEASMTLLQQAPADRLVIHCEPTFAARCLRGQIQRLREALNRVDIELITNHQLPARLPQTTDLVIHYRRPPAWRKIHMSHLMDLDGFPACSPSLLARMTPVQTPDDLYHFHLLHSEDRTTWINWLQSNSVTSITGERGTVYEDFCLTIEAAVAGEGVIIADPVFCRAELAQGLLVPLFKETIPCASYYVVCHQSGYQRPLIRQLHDWIMKEYAILQSQ